MPLFPIHDLRREDDIRMRRRRAALLLGGIVLGGWMLLGPVKREQHDTGHGDVLASLGEIEGAIRLADRLGHSRLPRPGTDDPSRTLSITGRLDVDIGCASSITLLSEPGMSPDQVSVSVRHDQSEALASLTINQQASRIGQGAGCDGGGAAEADFILRVPQGKPLAIAQWNTVDIRGGTFDGPVQITVNGSGNVSLDRTGPLTVGIRSSGDVSVGSVHGRLDADLMGSGDLSVSGGEIQDLVLQLRSSGDVRLNHARLTGQASVSTYSNGDVVGGAFAGTGFAATTHGSGDIVFSSVDAPTGDLLDAGSGDINIRGGHIGVLSVQGMGSGDITVRAHVDIGRILHHGNGDITVPKLERQLSPDNGNG